MKHKIVTLLLVAVTAITSFQIGKTQTEPVIEVQKIETIPNGYINIYDVKGWECWDDGGEVGLEIGGYRITKEPFTVETTVEVIK